VVTDDLPRLVRERLDDPMGVCSALNLLDRFKRQAGGGVMIRCPAHQDSSPSCSVTVGPDRTLRWRCFACSASGDVLTLIATVHGLDVRRDFVRVLDAGAELAGIRVEREAGRERVALPERRAPRPAPEPEQPAVDAETFARVVAPLMRSGVLDGRGASSEVCEYLEGRGLLEAARADGWFAMGPASGVMLCDVLGAELVARCGLADARGELKWPDHTLAIPWRTPTGTVQTIQRRHLGQCDAKRRYVFPTGRGPAHPYGIERITRRGPIAIVEGAMDVLAWREAAPPTRYETPLGVPGVSGWKVAWDQLVADRIVLIAYDDDDAGNREVDRLRERFERAGAAHLGRGTPMRGKDWADGLRRSA